MRVPSFKSTLIFAVGFTSCLLGLAVLALGGYYFWIKPLAANQANGLAQRLEPPPLPAPHPADFNFEIFDTNNQRIDFRDYRGRVVVLNFWATWCPPCQAELPSLGKLAAHYAGQKSVAVVCVSEESPAVIARNPGAVKSQAPVYSLNGQPTPQAYHTDAIPATFLIDEKGMIVFRHIGSADWADPSVFQFIDTLRNQPAQ